MEFRQGYQECFVLFGGNRKSLFHGLRLHMWSFCSFNTPRACLHACHSRQSTFCDRPRDATPQHGYQECFVLFGGNRKSLFHGLRLHMWLSGCSKSRRVVAFLSDSLNSQKATCAALNREKGTSCYPRTRRNMSAVACMETGPGGIERAKGPKDGVQTGIPGMFRLVQTFLVSLSELHPLVLLLFQYPQGLSPCMPQPTVHPCSGVTGSPFFTV
jgi:hypothetical protein